MINNPPIPSLYVYERRKISPFQDGLSNSKPMTFEYIASQSYINGNLILPKVIKVDQTLTMLKTNTFLALWERLTYTKFKIISGLRTIKVNGKEWLFGDVKNWQFETKSLFILHFSTNDIISIEVFTNFYPQDGELYKFLYRHLFKNQSTELLSEFSHVINQNCNDRRQKT